MNKVGAFEVFKRMVDTDDKALELAPLENITQAKANRHGTLVTIGTSGNRVGAILNGKYMGGLILCDRERFEEVKREMEKETNAAV